MLPLLKFCFVALVLLSACGQKNCLNQAACPDGSWNAGASGSSGISSNFRDFMASALHRDKASAQMTLAEELTLGVSALPVGYRKVPQIGNDAIPTPGDDDGAAGGAVTWGARPSTVCGTIETTVDARVASCAAANSSMATWNGSTDANSAQGQWRLVTFNGTHEVWRDERTKLVWSDRLGQTNWCRATGSSGGGPYGEPDQYNYCDNVALQPVQANPESWCTEDPGLNTPALYDSMKGGMRLLATGTSPSIVWRVPTSGDYNIAEANGMRFPFPNLGGTYWSSTVVSADRRYALGLFGNGRLSEDLRNFGANFVRCVGR